MLLKKVKARLKELNIPYELVQLSPNPKRKIRITINGKHIDFGSKNSIAYLEGASGQKERLLSLGIQKYY